YRHLEVVRAALEHDVEPRVGEQERSRRRGGGGKPRAAVPGREGGQKERGGEDGVETGPGEIPVLGQVVRRQRGGEPDRPRHEREAYDSEQNDREAADACR